MPEREIMDYLSEYKRWLEQADDTDVQAELKKIDGNDEEIKNRFCAHMEFGTAGLRGIMGAGPGRMNVYTVRRATQGLADYIMSCYGEGAVAIGYDSRNNSPEFARACAEVLAGNGVKVYLYDRLMPTPMLSFAVRELKARAGIMITASHNPAQYNGYKVYGSDGCQMTPEDTAAVSARIDEVDLFDGIRTMDFDKGLADESIRYVGKHTIERYYQEVEKQQIYTGVNERYPVKVLYSPLNGTGNEPVRRVLHDIGVKEVVIVPEQELPDGDFPTAPYPNPETKEALALGLKMCTKVKPDIFIATDPDADRVGVAVRDGKEYRILTGNEVGVLLLYYIIQGRTEKKTMPQNPIAIRSIVSTRLADEVAKEGGVEMATVLTGFKYIGEKILLLEQQEQQDRFLFGFEESCGYLAGTYVRDKDAVVASMLLCEMASWCKMKSMPIVVLLDKLYQKYGYYRNGVVNIEFSGLEGPGEMTAVMDRLYGEYPKELGGFDVVTVADYKHGNRHNLTLDIETKIDLPSSDVISFTLENGASVVVRPSGTEPKMKLYITTKEKTAEASDKLVKKLETAAKKLVKG